MPTPRERLQATLTELEAELLELPELDAGTRQRLDATLTDIRKALGRRADIPSNTGAAVASPASPEEQINAAAGQSFAERLSDATRGLESTHPQISTTLGSVISALAQMGI
jgi:uncharacterized protein DUF4404